MTTIPDALPEAEVMAQACVFILGIIVAWDGYWITRQRIDIPNLGELPNGGFAWESDSAQEVSRHWANLITMAAMMALPWLLAEMSDTPIIWVYLWDGLLAIHLTTLLISKRYAVTKTHLFADGQKYEWSRLRIPKHQPRRRLLLMRKGWGPFAPLPLGGKKSTLNIVLERIETILSEEE